jgi:hypothetical protein
MKIVAAVFETGTSRRTLTCFVCLFISAATSRAVDLYNLDFTAPELGTYQVTLGNPSVQSAAGPFTDALIFDAVTGGEQIRLPTGQIAPQYELQFDIFAHNLLNSDYSFGVYLDTATVRAVNFHGGLNSIYVYQPSPFLNFSLAPLANDSVYHFDVTLNAQSAVWSVAINGTSLFDGPWDGAVLQDVRFGLAPWIGGAANAPNTYVALDNVVVSLVPEPSAAALSVAGFLVWLKLHRRKIQSGS